VLPEAQEARAVQAEIQIIPMDEEDPVVPEAQADPVLPEVQAGPVAQELLALQAVPVVPEVAHTTLTDLEVQEVRAPQEVQAALVVAH